MNPPDTVPDKPCLCVVLVYPHWEMYSWWNGHQWGRLDLDPMGAKLWHSQYAPPERQDFPWRVFQDRSACGIHIKPILRPS